MGRWIAGGIGLLFFTIGVTLGLFVGKPELDAAKASESWVTTEGTVVESRVQQGNGGKRNRKSSSTYRPVIVFEYEVEGKNWTSNRPWFGSQIATDNRAMVQGFVDECPKGKVVTVYYDPENPAEAVLQPGASISSYFMVAFGAVFAMVGGVMVFFALFAGNRKGVFVDGKLTT